VKVERNVLAAMRDGTRLAADIYRPDDSAAHPAVVQRTPYNKSNQLYTFGATIDVVAFVERGYAVVVQDCRGRFESEGAWEPFRNEIADGHDTVEWIAGEPWCNGRVGAWGNSYMGTTALLAGVAAPPHLEAVFAYMGGPSHHNGWAYTSGALELSFDYFWLLRGAWETLRRSDLSPERKEAFAETLRRVGSRPGREIGALPVEDLPGLDAELVPFWRTWLDHPSYDDYWRACDAVANADAIDVPVCHVTGFHDNFLSGHLDLNSRLKDHPSTAVRDNHRFVIGPWDHEAYMSARSSAAGAVDFTPDAPNAAWLCNPIATEWFDHWLLDRGDLDATARARYFDTGKRVWHDTESWPPPSRSTALYLGSGGNANTLFGDGVLAAAPNETDAQDEFTYDPFDPVPTVGGRTLCPAIGPAGIQDQREVEQRADVLVYTTPALVDDLTIAGTVTALLYASTDGEDTDFTAKLVDVEPDGACLNVAEGIVRCRYRGGTANEVFMVPDTTTELSISLLDAAHTFRPGHRVRLEISSSNFPRFDRNLNTRVHPARGGVADARTAHQRVYHGESQPSRLDLPVVSA
jgi:putative CocE/NonD family hydrolase